MVIFSVDIRDAEFQVISTAWVLAAEARWDGANGLAITALALDRQVAGVIAQNSHAGTAAGTPKWSQQEDRKQRTARQRQQPLLGIGSTNLPRLLLWGAASAVGVCYVGAAKNIIFPFSIWRAIHPGEREKRGK